MSGDILPFPSWPLQCARRSQPASSDVPAPGEYEIPEVWRSGTAFTMTGRVQVRGLAPAISQPFRNQGASLSSNIPCAFFRLQSAYKTSSIPEVEHLPSKHSVIRLLQERPHEDSPGPGQYHSSNVGLDPLTRVAPAAPAYSIGTRHPDLRQTDSPGPGEYHK